MEPKITLDESAAAAAAVTADPTVEEKPNERDLATLAERERVQGIQRAVENARLPQSFADEMISDGTTLLDARGKVLDTMAKQPKAVVGNAQTPSGIRIAGQDPMENVWRGIEGALLHRIDPKGFPLDDNAKQYRTRSLLRCAEECLERRGIRTRDLSKMEIAGMALGLQVRAGLHTTSDFSYILADVANKTLRRAYDAAPATWMPIARRIPMPDFKPVKRNQLGEAPALTKVLEHGEFTRGTVAEGKEEFQLSTYGRIFGITRQALVNDDLDAFGRMTMSFGRSARNLESDIVWYQILKNAAMADTYAIFDATATVGHGNYTSPGTAIAVDSLGVGFAAMQNQKGLDKLTYLNVSPKFLIVPPTKITIAMQYTTQINPALGSSVNPWAGVLQAISEPRLQGGVTLDGDTAAGSTTAWYLAATPDQIDVIEYGYLDGEEGPVVESRVGFDVDGLEIKCRHDFAAKVIDFRGLYKNAGA